MRRNLQKFNFENSPVMSVDSGTLNIFVFGRISRWWGTNKTDVLFSLKGNSYSQINLIISSNGGEIDEALVIRDLLKAYPANVTTYLTGLCASAATILADAGNAVVMSRSCIYMIHKPLFEYTGGNADELRKDAEMLDTWENIAVGIYQTKTGLPDNEIRALLKQESWLGPDEALALGFVDEVVDVLDIDFELDTAGTEPEEELFICEPIYFKNSKEVYNQAVANALKGGYRQISPAQMQVFQPKVKKFDMKDFLKSIVTMLVSAGIIPADKEQDAVNATANLETPEMLASIVKEEIAKHQPTTMKVTDVTKLITNATDEEKAAIASALGIPGGYDDTDIKSKVTDLSGKVAALMVGEGGGAGTNGDPGVDGGTQKTGSKTYKETEAAKMYLRAYENGQIDGPTYKQLTGEDVPKKKRV